MAIFFAILSLMVIPGLIIFGLIKPTLFNTTRKRIILIGIPLMFLSLLGLGLTAPEETEEEIAREESVKHVKSSENTVDLSDNTETTVETSDSVDTTHHNPEIEDKKDTETNTPPKPFTPPKSSFKTECEDNANKYPAKQGQVLVTKGPHNFTGMKYYFKGELVAIGTHEEFNNRNVWLLKNDHGYVMPVYMYESSDEPIGSEIEIWGTLSGEGYRLPNVDNVVGETGAIHMIQYSVDGEDKQ